MLWFVISCNQLAFKVSHSEYRVCQTNALPADLNSKRCSIRTETLQLCPTMGNIQFLKGLQVKEVLTICSTMKQLFMSVSLFCLFSCTSTSMRVAWYKFLPMLSHYYTDLQMAQMHKELQQHPNSGREEEHVNLDVNNAG